MPGRDSSLASDELLSGVLNYTVDFRAGDAAVLERWLKTGAPILGGKFGPLQIDGAEKSACLVWRSQ